jgi:hypothetical protein
MLGLVAGLVFVAAGQASAAKGGNSNNAKVCKDWASLFREDGSTFADRGECVSYAAMGGVILTSPPVQPLPNQVVVNAPSSAAGLYEASGASFGPSPSLLGVGGTLVMVNDSTASPTLGCSPLVGFPAGAIAIVDRGDCPYMTKVANAQAAGAAAVIVVNNVAGAPTTMTGSDPSLLIPSVMVAQADGFTFKAGLPATGIVRAAQ